MKELYSALIKAQSEMKIAVKDNTNPHFRNKYADFGSVYDACRDALHRNGLAVLQPTRIHESGVTVVVTKIIHTSGQCVEGEYPVLAKDMTDPQKHGGGLTYARRYSLASMLGVIQDDDDGNSAAGHTAPPAKTKVEPTQLLEGYFKKPIAQWSEAQKEIGRKAFMDLKAGKPWETVKRELEKAEAFS